MRQRSARYFRFRFVVITFSLTLISACSAVQESYGIDATDLSWIVPGTKLEEIKQRLGAPEATKQNGTLTVATYRFNRGYRPPSQDSPAWMPFSAVGHEVVNLLSWGSNSYWVWECQRAELQLQYDAQELVISATESQNIPDIALNPGPTWELCSSVRNHLRPSTLSFGKDRK